MTVETTVYCKRCSTEMSSAIASSSIEAIRVLVIRDVPDAVGELDWQSGPLCRNCLSASSSMIHRGQSAPLKKWGDYFKEAQGDQHR